MAIMMIDLYIMLCKGSGSSLLQLTDLLLPLIDED